MLDQLRKKRGLCITNERVLYRLPNSSFTVPLFLRLNVPPTYYHHKNNSFFIAPCYNINRDNAHFSQNIRRDEAMQERRKYVRYKTQGSVKIKPANDQSWLVAGELISVCCTGFGVFAKEKIEVGTDVKFEFIVDSLKEPVSGTGRISYLREETRQGATIFRMGIHIRDINQDAIRHILAHLQGKLCAMARKTKR
jgi:PilZ domain